MSVRELINQYRKEIGSSTDLFPERAAKILTELSALLGNVNDEIRKRQAGYNQALLFALDSEKSAARAKIKAEASQTYLELKEAKDAKEVCLEMIRGLKYYLKAKQDEWHESKNL